VVAEAADGQQIVPVALWQRVQGILTDPERRTSPGRPSGTPLSGIARCGKRGGPMNASNKWEKGGRRRLVYLVIPGRTGLDGLRVEWAEWATPDAEVV
jgi:hypothetical protein